jgi:hypothetical protein
MTDSEMITYLRDNGYPEHVVKAGRRGLVDRWNKFVDDVKSGYKFGLEDYRNDLDLRGIIGMLGLDGEVREADAELESLLSHKTVRVWESGADNAFWDFGYPRNASGELLGDLRDEGLAE